MTVTTTSNDMSRLGHLASMAVAAVEYRRFADLIRSLSPTDWSRPTDCTAWDVKAVVCHNLGNMAGNASMRENIHQMRTAMKRSRANATSMVDEMTGLQVSERVSRTPAQLCDEIERLIPKALAGRRRTPALLRRTVKIKIPAPHNTLALGYLIDQIYNRDMFMHRVDICRATGREPALDADHEGRLIAEIVGDWAANHGRHFDLVLDGPAGGAFRHGEGGEQLRLDAVAFARIVSGRRDGNPVAGLLATEVLY
ncbi:MAG TPA: maleylpyruvate isomerase family mycothiol-dependent enzyme [Mycobacteriales bacterium]|nr:maleylpyruvate isomerase family mycothiol-dependent enzyme [Mycobacteriales bacterium]